MSTSADSAAATHSSTRRARRPPTPLVAAALVTLVVVVVAAAVLVRGNLGARIVGAIGTPTPALAASQTLSLFMKEGSGAEIAGASLLDPAQAEYDLTSEQIVRLLFDNFVTLNAKNEVELWGADRLAVSPDGLTYSFHLRTGQFFSDVTPVKASDYAWSLNRAFNPCIAADWGDDTRLALLKDATAFSHETCASDQQTITGAIQTLVGDSILASDSAETLTLVLAQPAANFLSTLTLPFGAVMDRRNMHGLIADDAWLDGLVSGPTGSGGSGMFYVAAWNDAGSLTLKPNPHWWGVALGKHPHFTAVNIHLYSNNVGSDEPFHLYDSTPYDYLDAISPYELPNAVPRTDYQIIPSLHVGDIVFNWNEPPLDSRDVRQALCLALNRDALEQQRENNWLNSGSPAQPSTPAIPTWHLVPQGMPGYDPHLTGIDGVTATNGDLAKAQGHWQAYLATLHGQPVPHITFTTGFTPQDTANAKAVVAEWTAALPGLHATTDQFSFVGLYLAPYLPVNPQVADAGWGPISPDPEDIFSTYFASDAAYSGYGVSVPQADALLAIADHVSDPAQQNTRMSLYFQAEQELVQQVAVCPLSQPQNTYLLRPYIVGMRQNGLYLFPNDDWLTGYVAKH